MLDAIQASRQSCLCGEGDTFHPQARLALGPSHTSLSVPEAILMTAAKHLQAQLCSPKSQPAYVWAG